MHSSILGDEFGAIAQLLSFWLSEAIRVVDPRGKFALTIDTADGERKQEDSFIPVADVRCGGVEKPRWKADSLVSLQVKDETQLVYVSPIALQLSKSWQKPSLDIATEIIAHLSDRTAGQDVKKANFRPEYFTVKVVSPGWIYWQLKDFAIASWLQSLAQAPPWVGGSVGVGETEERPASAIFSHSPTLFSAQYAHARCCSLLRLAHREGIIRLETASPPESPSFWRAIAPQPIPWLTEAGELRLGHLAERNLIHHLFAGLDAVYCASSKSDRTDWEKLAGKISLSFEKFYSQCRIWGEVKAENLDLSQARLGLLMATQAILRLLLEELLGAIAPLEL